MAIPERIDLTEVSAGVYEASFTVEERDRSGVYPIRAVLVAPNGIEVSNETASVQVEAPPPKGPAGPPLSPEGSKLSNVPDNLDKLASVISWVIVFYGLYVATRALILFGWLSILAAIALSWMLRDFLVTPVQKFIKAIIFGLFETIVDLVQAVGKFFEVANTYYGGNFARMVINMAIISVAGFLFPAFLELPAVKGFVSFIRTFVDESLKLTKQIVQGVDAFLRTVQREFNDWVKEQISGLRGQVGIIPELIAAAIAPVVQFFNSALNKAIGRLTALEARIDTFRAEVLRYVTIQIGDTRVRIDLLKLGLPSDILATIAGSANTIRDLLNPPPTPEELRKGRDRSVEGASLLGLENDSLAFMLAALDGNGGADGDALLQTMAEVEATADGQAVVIGPSPLAEV